MGENRIRFEMANEKKGKGQVKMYNALGKLFFKFIHLFISFTRPKISTI